MRYLYASIAVVASMAVCGHFHVDGWIGLAILLLIGWATFRPRADA